MSFSHDMDDEYEKLCRRMNPPRSAISFSSLLLKVNEFLPYLFLRFTPLSVLSGL